MPTSILDIGTSISEATPSSSYGIKPTLVGRELEPSRAVRLEGPQRGLQGPPPTRDGYRSLPTTLSHSILFCNGSA
jgi:hypothetical protein